MSGRSFWLSGKSGTGKTTIARLIAQDMADPFLIQEVDASALTVAQLKDLEYESNLKGFGDKSGRAFIVNEAHGLRKDVIRQLLVMLERIPPHVVRVFTTTIEGQESLFEDYDDASPLLSRCLRLDLTGKDLARAFAIFQGFMEKGIPESDILLARTSSPITLGELLGAKCGGVSTALRSRPGFRPNAKSATRRPVKSEFRRGESA